MTLIVVPIFVSAAPEVAGALERARAMVQGGARMIEWRVDPLAGEPEAVESVRRLVSECPAPCIVTCRAPEEGGLTQADEDERRGLLAAVAGLDEKPRYVDVEHATLERHPGLRDRLVSGSDETGDGMGVILSAHDFEGRPVDLIQRVEAMTNTPGVSVVKVAWAARSLRDNLEAFDLLAERRRPTVALCMGEFGLMSRVLAPKFGGLLTYAAGASADESAPGQPTLEGLRELYRFDSITPRTRVYGVVGWPVAHSRGPRLHNAGFAAVGHDGIYLPLPVPTEYEHFKATIGSMVDHPGLDFAGASVTIPHKEHLLRFVTERGGRVDAPAERIGAANTLVVGGTGAVGCLNTDAPAALQALAAGLGVATTALAGIRVVVLGAGGVARAVVASLSEAGARVVVASRRHDRAEALAHHFRSTRDAAGHPAVVTAAHIDAIGGERFDVIANCTPVGMTGGPEPGRSPLHEDVPLDDEVTVLDTVYTPVRTPLVREAEARGARVVTGVDMFLRQAALQFEQWTGKPAPMDAFRAALDRP